MGIDVAPNQNILYTANAISETIVPFNLNRLTGDVTPTGTPVDAVVGGLIGVFVHPSGNFAYGQHFFGAITSYLIAADGTISANAASPPIDQNGRFPRFTFNLNGDRLYAVDGDTGTITIFTINLTNGVLEYLPTLMNGVFPAGLGNASDSLLSRDGNFLYVSDREGNSIHTYAFDVEGSLVATTSVDTDPGPKFLALHPTLPALYCVNDATTINAFTTGAGGVLAPLGASIPTVTGVRQILVDPSGDFLFAYEAAGEIHVYAVGATGELSFLESYDFPNELTFAVDAAIVPALAVEEPPVIEPLP